jgi:hypothetical protein
MLDIAVLTLCRPYAETLPDQKVVEDDISTGASWGWCQPHCQLDDDESEDGGKIFEDKNNLG